MTDSKHRVTRFLKRKSTLIRFLAILGAAAVIKGMLSAWNFNSNGFEVTGVRVGVLLAVLGAVVVVVLPNHPVGAVLAVVGGGRAGVPAGREILRSLGGELWFAGFVWMGVGALLLVLAGVVSAATLWWRTGAEPEPSTGDEVTESDGFQE